MVSALVAFDERISYNAQHLVQVIPTIWKMLAIFGVYVIPIVLLWYWFARDRLTALRVAVAGVVAWFGFNSVISHLVIRQRPPQIAALHFPAHEFLFDRPGPSFPSDHAAFLAAVTLSFALAGERKLTPYLAVLTVATLLARVVTAQHWVGDILVGIVVGAVSAGIVHRLRNPLDRLLLKPLIVVVGKVGL